MAAADELQTAIADEDWGAIGRMRIRIAMVTGEVEVQGDRYYGPPLFRAARLQALANGGRRSLAGTTVDELADGPPEGHGAPRPRRRSGCVTSRSRSGCSRWCILPARAQAEPYEESEQRQGIGRVSDEEGPIRVLLVDDHAVVRRGLRGFLELLKDFDVVGEAENGREGVAAADRLVPDVILMDLLMPEMGGLEAIAAIKEAHPEIEIVAVTSFIEEEKVTSALEAGASGYLLKDAEAEEVAQAIRAAYNGEVHLDPAVSRLLAQRLRQRQGRRADRAAHHAARRRSSRSWPRERRTRRSPTSSASPSARRAPTSRTSSASSASPRAPRLPCTRSSTSSSDPRSR